MNENVNNRSSVIVKLVIWSVVAVVLMAILAVALINAGGWNIFGMGISVGGSGFSLFGGEVYEDADTYDVGDRVYTDSIEDINIDWTDGDVALVIWDGDGVKLVEKGHGGREQDKMRTRVVDGKLDVRFVKSGYRWFSSYPSKQLTVYIPADVAAALDKVRVNSVSADVNVQAQDSCLSCNRFEIVCVSGDVELVGVDAKTVSVEGVSSRISYKGHAGELSVQGVSGDLTFVGEIGKVSVEAVSGKVHLDTDNVPSSIDIETVSGSVNVYLPSDKGGFDAELDSVSGNIKLNGKNEGKHCDFGDDSAKFNFETVSGNVNIHTK